MIIGLIGAICAAGFNVLIGYWVLEPYTTPRMLFISIAGFGLLAAWLISGPVLHISVPAAQAALVLLGVWVFCSFMAIRRDIALRHFVTFGFCVFFGLFLVPAADPVAVIEMLVGVATVSAVIGLLANLGNVQVFPKIRPRKHREVSGMVGNANAHGAYLAIHAFLAGYLALYQHPLWAASLVIILIAIWRARGLGPVVGLLAGGLFMTLALDRSILIRVALFNGIFFFAWWLVEHMRSNPRVSIRERRHYWRVAWEMFAESPLWGTGFASFPIRVPFIQRALNDSTRGEFLKKENYAASWPELAHNDFLQALTDNGTMGMAALIVMGVLCGDAVISGIRDPLVVFAGAALVSFLASGLTWHLFYVLPANMTVWCLVGMLLKTSAPWSVDVGPYWSFLALVPLGSIIWMYVVRHAAFLVHMLRYFKGGDVDYLKRALRLEPHSTFANQHAVLYCWRHGQYETAYTHAITALQHYDGNQQIWRLWTSLGNICRQHGSLTLANAAFNEALKFLPWFDLALIGREQLKETVVRIRAVTKDLAGNEGEEEQGGRK